MNAPLEVGAAHPMHIDNHIVMFGSEDDIGLGTIIRTPTSGQLREFFMRTSSIWSKSKPTLAGMNMSFDLCYLYRQGGEETKRYIQDMDIWDIQVAEYILSGQTIKFASLDELSVKYGLPVKDASLKEKYFGKGLGADHVPEDILRDYLVQDYKNTRTIAEIQYELAIAQKQLTLIRSQMKALHAIIEMMYNGLYVDIGAQAEHSVKVVNAYAKIKTDLETLVGTHVTNIDSPAQWSKYFFGGYSTVTEKTPDGFFKNGKPKFKKVDIKIAVSAVTSYIPSKDKVSEKTGNVSVDEEVLEDIVKGGEIIASPVAASLLEYRKLSKDLNTYVVGLSKHVLGNTIHGNINAAATGTGRLSSSNPNLQNISNNEIKQIFTSRFHSGGVLIEVDFNQLEIVILACITKDRQLMKDIVDGTDIHSALYEDLYGRKPTKEERKPFKSRTFQLIYGAGPKAISKMAKCSLDEAKRFVKTFYDRYPDVQTWHTNIIKQAEVDGSHHIGPDGAMDAKRTYTYKAVTGRHLKFVEYKNESEYSSRSYSFSPTELKNYPVQSLATGDIVQMMLGILFDKYKLNPNVRMVNTIHDSILFDVKAEHAVEFMEDVLEELRNTHKYFFYIFRVDLAIPLNASASYGFDWYNMKETEL
jgi:DNA polymerase I-like protein with 3'-5' exonuclease and polymerase domains